MRYVKAAPLCEKPGDAVAAELVQHLQAVIDVERQRELNNQRITDILQRAFGENARLSKAVSVNGRLVFAVDGAIPECVRQKLYECLQTDQFRRTEFARPDMREFRHHVVEYNPERFRCTDLHKIIERLVASFFPAEDGDEPLEAYRIYTNAISFGDAAFVHRDSGDAEHVTVLVYPNPEWGSELGGETIFYDESGEIVDAVEPCPGRVCLFRGNILHKGSPPTRLLWGTRYTTAWKFAPGEPPGASPRESRY